MKCTHKKSSLRVSNHIEIEEEESCDMTFLTFLKNVAKLIVVLHLSLRPNILTLLGFLSVVAGYVLLWVYVPSMTVLTFMSNHSH
jgi:hypothetical protein